ncbi:hypothetical protein BGZ58_004917 [Dissophora ornata]|nr:hypothetical protein BGZ58_004917 [Dissophora ornata]
MTTIGSDDGDDAGIGGESGELVMEGVVDCEELDPELETEPGPPNVADILFCLLPPLLLARASEPGAVVMTRDKSEEEHW